MKKLTLTAMALATFLACNIANATPNTAPAASQTTETLASKQTYQIQEQRISLPNGQSIYGKLYRPTNATGKQPIVIYSHGLAGNYEILENFAKALAEKGVTGYAFDFRGGGNKSQSSGKTTEMTVLTEIDDLTHIVNAVKKWDFVDSSKIVLMGESQGGAVSALTAAQMPNEIAGLITFYPAYAMVDDATKLYPDVSKIPTTTRYFNVIDLGKQYFIDAQHLDPYHKIGNYTKPMLLVHGSKDPIVNIKYSEQASRVYPNVTYKVIDGAPHSFAAAGHFEQALSLVEAYLKTNQLMK